MLTAGPGSLPYCADKCCSGKVDLSSNIPDCYALLSNVILLYSGFVTFSPFDFLILMGRENPYSFIFYKEVFFVFS